MRLPSFNSRTREGCDKGDRLQWDSYTRFNSRTREGCDVLGVRAVSTVFRVSIHAPGRGATYMSLTRIMI